MNEENDINELGVQKKSEMDISMDNNLSSIPTAPVEIGQNGQVDKPFPIETFPESIRALIVETNTKLNFPIEFMSTAILSVASVAIGATREIQITEGWKTNSILYCMIVGLPGTCKTHPINFAMAPLKEREKLEYKNYYEKLNEYLALPGKEQKEASKPKFRQTILKDATREALIDALQTNKRGLLYHKDEIIALIKDFTRYSSSGSDLEFYLSNWSNDSVSTNRKSTGYLRVDNPFVSLIGTIQPSVLKTLLYGLDNNGFIDRFLVSFPDNLKRKKFNENEISIKVMEQYSSTINRLFSLEFADGVETPKVLKLSKEAKKYWKEWYDLNIERQDKASSERLQSVYSKLDSIVPRLALILEMLYNIEDATLSETISEKALRNAVRVSEYYFHNLKKVLALEKIDLSDKKKAAKELHDLGKSTREIAQIIGVKSPQTVSNYINS